MTPWGTPDHGARADERAPYGRVADEPRQPPEGPVARSRSVLAPVLLALTTIAGLAGAVLALLPAAMTRRPAGRLGPRSAPPDPDGDTQSEPLAR